MVSFAYQRVAAGEPGTWHHLDDQRAVDRLRRSMTSCLLRRWLSEEEIRGRVVLYLPYRGILRNGVPRGSFSLYYSAPFLPAVTNHSQQMA